MKPKLSLLLNISIPFLIIVGLCLVLVGTLGHADAESAPNKTVLRIVQNVEANQEIITETRDAHIQFMTAKDDNNYQIRKLKELCYDLDWSTLALTKVEGCSPEVLN